MSKIFKVYNTDGVWNRTMGNDVYAYRRKLRMIFTTIKLITFFKTDGCNFFFVKIQKCLCGFFCY